MNQYGPSEKRPLSFYDSPVMNQKTPRAHNATFAPEAESIPETAGPQKFTAPPQTAGKPVPASSSSNAFAVQYFTNSDAKIIKKVEYSPSGQMVWNYTFDSTGHLVEARRNNALAEKYEYSSQGARIKDHRRWCNDSRTFSYDQQGRLKAAGDRRFTWSDSGNLRTTECNGALTRYHYGDDTRLDTVLLPRGEKITYHYDKELLPVKIARNGLPILEFGWKNTLHLTRYMDRINNILYVFKDDEKGTPKQVTLSGPEAVMSRITGQPGAHLKLNIHVDHLGSIRCLEAPDGTVVKSVEYDSFGNVMHDSRPNFPFPLGFAGGLVDPFTGFIRFGYRDYDPNVGRFTAKDPLGDTGGDHDLYDYCVDDPVSCVDPMGLQEIDIDSDILSKTIQMHPVLKKPGVMATESRVGRLQII